MSVTTNIPVTNIITENQDVLQEIGNIFIQKTGGVFWVINWIKNEGEENQAIHKQEWFKIPSIELGAENPVNGVDTFYNMIKDKLWEKSIEIRSMPDGTDEERRAKMERYGSQIAFEIKVIV